MWIAGKYTQCRRYRLAQGGAGGHGPGHDHPPADPFSTPAQKAIYWIVVLGGGAVAVSGYVLMFPFYGTDIHSMQIAEVVHAIVAVLFVAAMLGHIYIGTIGHGRCLRGDGQRDRRCELGQGAPIISGSDQEMGRTGPNTRQKQPLSRPAE